MVHSVLAVEGVGKVTRDLGREEKFFERKAQSATGTTFSQVLEREVEERRTDSINCRTLTYGNDRMLHRFEYRAREYHY